MSNDKRTRAEQLSAILRDLDSLSAEARQLGERTEKINRKLIEMQFAIAHFLTGRAKNDRQ